MGKTNFIKITFIIFLFQIVCISDSNCVYLSFKLCLFKKVIPNFIFNLQKKKNNTKKKKNQKQNQKNQTTTQQKTSTFFLPKNNLISSLVTFTFSFNKNLELANQIPENKFQGGGHKFQGATTY